MSMHVNGVFVHFFSPVYDVVLSPGLCLSITLLVLYKLGFISSGYIVRRWPVKFPLPLPRPLPPLRKAQKHISIQVQIFPRLERPRHANKPSKTARMVSIAARRLYLRRRWIFQPHMLSIVDHCHRARENTWKTPVGAVTSQYDQKKPRNQAG